MNLVVTEVWHTVTAQDKKAFFSYFLKNLYENVQLKNLVPCVIASYITHYDRQAWTQANRSPKRTADFYSVLLF